MLFEQHSHCSNNKYLCSNNVSNNVQDTNQSEIKINLNLVEKYHVRKCVQYPFLHLIAKDIFTPINSLFFAFITVI